ncbi:MAG TPA: hypothetical protein VE987_10365 [Polyangiaceae bacterium]|nr:hypothetical protein [Polyangiaceae bacterium]
MLVPVAAALGSALASGCASSPPQLVAVPTLAGDGRAAGARPRKPDAVVLERAPALPESVDRSAASGVVALREPLGDGPVRDLVRALLDAWARESIDDLAALLTSDAGPIEARSRGRGALVEAWRQRLRAHEYGRLSAADLVQSNRIERYRWEDLPGSNPGARPAEMREDELLVRVPLEVTHVAGERLFGDVILLLLRREGDKYKIAAYGEVNAD